MKKILISFLLLYAQYTLAQRAVRYSGAVEAGMLKFQNRTITADPGPNWKGYNLDQRQNGITLNVVNGVVYRDRLFCGLGLGWLNFDGINGVSVFGDFFWLVTKTRLAPVVGAKMGYTRLFNQYEGGTGSPLIELDGGLAYRFTERSAVEVRSGVTFTQQAAFIPLKLRLRF